MRRPDWDQRLSGLIAGHFDSPYAWGSHDCILFAANAVKAVTGKDLGRGHRSKYKGRLSAVKYLKKLGFDSPEALIDSLLEEKPIGFAQRGDIILAKDGIPAICMGSFALSVGQQDEHEGLVRVPREDWIKAWSVGEQHADFKRKKK